MARTCSGLAVPSRPLAWAALPTNRPRGLTAAGEVLFAVAGDLVQPVGLLARLQCLHRQRHPAQPFCRHQGGSRASQMRMCRTTGIAVRIARRWARNAEEVERYGSWMRVKRLWVEGRPRLVTGQEQ